MDPMERFSWSNFVPESYTCVTIAHRQDFQWRDVDRPIEAIFLFATHGKLYLHNRTWLSLMRPEGISNDNQAEISALPSCRTPWAQIHWYFCTSIKDQNVKSIWVFSSRKAFEIDKSYHQGRIQSRQIGSKFLNNGSCDNGSLHTNLQKRNPSFWANSFQPFPFFRVNKLTTTAYHLRTHGQVDCYGSDIVARLQQNVLEHQKKLIIYAQPLRDT